MLQSWSRALVNLLRIKRGTWLSSFVQTIFAFAVTGFLHGIAASRIEPTPPFSGQYERFWALFLFFTVQAIGVIIEDVVSTVVDEVELAFEWDDEKGRTNGWRDWIGRLWVLGWLLWTGQLVLECWLKTGQGMIIVPFSFISLGRQHFGY
jgi:hypothetical protein